MTSYKKDVNTGKWRFVIAKKENPMEDKQIKKCGFNTKQEAIDARDLLIKELKEKAFVFSNEILFEDGVKIYFKKELDDTTKNKYESHLKNHISPFFKGKEIVNIHPLYIDDWILQLIKQNVGIPTVQDCLKLCNAICNRLIMKKVIIRNPFKGAEIPKKELEEYENLFNEEIKVFQEKDILILWNGAIKLFGKYNDYFYTILVLAFSSGMRIGEILGLDIKYIRFEKGEIDIRQQFTDNKIKFKLKNKNSKRTIKPGAFTMETLYEYIKFNNITEGLLFKNKAGNPISRNNMERRRWKRLLKSLNFDERLHFHYIRHTYASIKLSRGENYMKVSKDMGHASPDVTLRIYAEWIPKDEEKTLEISQILNHDTFMTLGQNKRASQNLKPSIYNGAGDEARTRDIFLGKEAFYH